MADYVNSKRDYGLWDLSKLKKELKSKGGKISGRKKDLIERLEFFDRNKNLENEVLEKEYVMVTPNYDSYKDINTDIKFTPLKLEAIHCYLEQFEKNLDNDSQKLYTNRFLKYLRITSTDSLFFFKSECRAEMKKKVSYHINISADLDGTITECECECAAGMGPTAHCKHVCATLYAIHKFSICSELITEQSCTSKLQTFHQSRHFMGSPLKSQNLPLPGVKDVNFEPRPTKYIKMSGYNDMFRNVWLNHPNINNFPISQTFKPANAYAVETDHHYFQKPLSDIWLQNIGLSNINNDNVSSIEQLTRGQSSNQLWSQIRCYRLNSSQFGKICKVTERTDLDKLAKALTEPCQIIQAAPLIHGKKFEKIAIDEFVAQTRNTVDSCGTFVCKTNPFLASSPDGLIDTDKVIEVKCPFSSKDKCISTDTVPYLKFHEIEEKYYLSENHDYYYQVQGQLLCTGRQKCIFIVYTFKDLKFITINRNDTFINSMVQKLTSFYNNHFKKALLDKFYYKDYYKYSF